MQRFKTGNIVLSELCLDSTPKDGGSMRNIVLKLENWSGATPNIQGGSFLKVTSQSHNKAARVTTFRIEAVPNATGVGYVYNEASNDDAVLRVTVGNVKNHGGFEHDLIADLLGRSEEPLKLWVYARILARDNNIVGDRKAWDTVLKEQPLKQTTDPAHPANWNCGAALNQFGHDFFGAKHYRTGDKFYYKPFNSGKTSANKMDIVFDTPAVTQGVQNIKGNLAKG